MATQTETQENKRGRLNEAVGTVVSDKANKTVSVLIYRLVKHSRYRKFIRLTSVFKAHDEENQAKTGDRVRIKETRPISKTKRWKLMEVIEKADNLDGSTK